MKTEEIRQKAREFLREWAWRHAPFDTAITDNIKAMMLEFAVAFAESLGAQFFPPSGGAAQPEVDTEKTRIIYRAFKLACADIHRRGDAAGQTQESTEAYYIAAAGNEIAYLVEPEPRKP